ncbi:MAG TPA: bifunctional diguanylate cyclase/phosphodiesterase [Solirubrobacteraceae bacterium]
MVLSAALTFATIGIVGYVLLERNLANATFDHRAYGSRLHEIRVTLAVILLFGVLAGGLVFYLLGGRRLMRDHRMALRRATRDGLTDLPNQRAFQEEFPDAVAAGTRYGDPLALVLFDVDDLKLINERHGRRHGDAILTELARVLRSSRPGDRPYRIGGDEFAMVLSHTDAAGAKTLARRLSRGFSAAGVEVSMGASVRRPGVAADTLRAEADAALNEARRQGGNRAAYFDELDSRSAVTTAQTKDAVRRLTEEGRLETVFQPIWNFDTEALLGIEALTRPDPAYGLSGPAEAFDVAEQLGCVHQLDVLCAQSALRSASSLLPQGALLFINLAPITLDLDADGDDWLSEAVDRAELEPQQIVIEVTERFGARTASILKCLERLRGQGFKVAVDHVGTGNCGVEMLRRMQAEFVKIDRSIVGAAATEPGARAVLMAIATFARQSGAFVIAEGIEDEDTLQFLRSIGQREISPEMIIQGGQGFQLGGPGDGIPSGSSVPPQRGRTLRRSLLKA